MSDEDPVARHRGAGRSRATVAVVTVSDTRDETTDRSGARVLALLENAGHVRGGYRIVRDDPEFVRRAVGELLDIPDCDGVILTGGTGLAARDTTYEAIDAILDKRIDGFGEIFRALSFEEIGSAAMLSRAQAGIARGKFVFSMPGSTGAVELAMTRLVLPELSHVLGLLDR